MICQFGYAQAVKKQFISQSASQPSTTEQTLEFEFVEIRCRANGPVHIFCFSKCFQLFNRASIVVGILFFISSSVLPSVSLLLKYLPTCLGLFFYLATYIPTYLPRQLYILLNYSALYLGLSSILLPTQLGSFSRELLSFIPRSLFSLTTYLPSQVSLLLSYLLSYLPTWVGIYSPELLSFIPRSLFYLTTYLGRFLFS